MTADDMSSTVYLHPTRADNSATYRGRLRNIVYRRYFLGPKADAAVVLSVVERVVRDGTTALVIFVRSIKTHATSSR